MLLHKDIDRFLGDPRIEMLRDRARETRALSICYPTEVPITRFLEWLMDPTEGHGLRDGPIRALLLQAWRQVVDGFEVPTAVRHFLSPSRIEAQSFEDSLLLREALLDGRKLDLLILEPRRKWLIAIENKFGAAQSENQLRHYRKALERQYPDWTQLLVYLDVYAQTPNDEPWFGMDYGWLSAELDTAIKSPWLADASRAILADFQAAIDPDPEETDDQLLDLVNEHRRVFEEMRTWDRAKAGLDELVSQVFSSAVSLDAKARQQLFKVYWQKQSLWEGCFPMLEYAALLKVARSTFEDIEFDPARKAVYFRRASWESVVGPEKEGVPAYWPVVVCVRPEPPRKARDEALFRVVSAIVPNRWHDEMLTCSEATIKQFRGEHMKRGRELSGDMRHYPLMVSRALGEDDVEGSLVKHLRAIDALMQQVHVRQ